jgi:putative serine protease PepD
MSDRTPEGGTPYPNAADPYDDRAAYAQPAQPPSDTYLPPRPPAQTEPLMPRPAAPQVPAPQPVAGGGPRKGRGRTGLFFASLLGAVVGAGLVMAALYLYPPAALKPATQPASVATTVTTTQAEEAPVDSQSIETAAAKVVPSVVNVSVSQTVTGQFGFGTQTQQGLGSGVIVRSDGYILTNNHVVQDAQTITVKLGADELPAKVVGTDPTTDLAVIKIARTGLTPATLGSSSGLKVGQWVIAVGSPFGLDHSVTAGIVSALNRTNIDTSTGSIAAYTNLIQSDAPINPGNSGGALADLEGRVVGINALIESPSGAVGAAQSAGIGFSIPIDFARDVADQLIAGKKVAHPYIGVGTVSVDPQIGAQYSLGVDAGALVQSVTKGSPADKAGIRNGDVIVRIGDMDVTSVEDLFSAIRSHKVGETVPVIVVRNKAKTTLRVTLASDATAQ